MALAIKAENITKRYTRSKNQTAITNLNLVVPRGTLYGLVGPDGAGKTTMLRILASVLRPSNGKVEVAGYPAQTQSEAIRKKIGYMPQNFSLYSDLSLIENLVFFADIFKVPNNKRKERIDAMLAFTHLSDFRDRRAGKLSGGMKKKLALACAMVHDPDILILDEPSTGVDPVSRRELWGILANVVRQGVTVLLSTPYMDEAERCHQVGMLYKGQFLVEGTPQDLIEHLPFQIIEVKAKPRKKMRQIIEATDSIEDWNPIGDRIRIAIPRDDSRDKMLKYLNNQFKEHEMKLSILRASRRSLEDVFVYLLKEQRKK